MLHHNLHRYHKKIFYLNETEYLLFYEKISVKKAVDIDYNSYKDGVFLTNLYWDNIFKTIHFVVYSKNEIIYDSLSNSTNNISFKLSNKIIEIIVEDLHLSESDTQIFKEKCILFKDGQATQMPYELLVAKNITSNNTSFSFNDIENMEIKSYEKIQIAISVLKESISQ